MHACRENREMGRDKLIEGIGERYAMKERCLNKKKGEYVIYKVKGTKERAGCIYS